MTTMSDAAMSRKRPREDDAHPTGESTLKKFHDDMDTLIATFTAKVQELKREASAYEYPVGETFDKWQRIGALSEAEWKIKLVMKEDIARLMRAAYDDA